MSTSPAPWRKVLEVRPDVLSGKLELAEFAADLYDVVQRRGSSYYSDPEKFFGLTFPTHNLRELVRNVSLRLNDQSNKSVHQINVTFGGGKTHTLITLYHIFHDPGALPDLPAVREFRQHAGVDFKRARVALLPFDKVDVLKGLEVQAPSGERRWWVQPWSLLAYQLLGEAGVRALHPQGLAEERDVPPADNLLSDLLRRVQAEAEAVLVLIDEPLLYARNADSQKLVDFFQYLTQTVVRIDRCALVASLLASDKGNTEEDNRLGLALQNVFMREKEATVVPVTSSDVAEILRRRLFTQASLQKADRFKEPVLAALSSIRALDEDTAREGADAEARYIAAYPFHPELTKVLYEKWTQVDGFQRTRGVLRTFALALRDAGKWDDSPLIGASAFLSASDEHDLSEALGELAQIAAADALEGRPQNWRAILEGEIEKAREVERENPTLRAREVEQAVVATFLHSQPPGKKAVTQDLYRLLGASNPDQLVLENALVAWASRSWFLDENDAQASHGELPRAWRLGSRPNLRQMHDDAKRRVTDMLVEAKLEEAIAGTTELFELRNAPSVVPHKLPETPDRIDDDGRFHFGVLGPKAASDPGSISPFAKRFIDETTSAERPRVNRNAIVLAVPSRIGIAQAREAMRSVLAWNEVERTADTGADLTRAELLSTYKRQSQVRLRDAIRQAYCLAVTVSKNNEITAHRVSVGNGPLFGAMVVDSVLRLTTAPVAAEALLPGGPFELWRSGETERYLSQIVQSFAQYPHLPKILDTAAIRRTMVQGVKDGLFTMRLERPDKSVRTWWLEEPDEAALREAGLAVVLSDAAELSVVPDKFLQVGVIPELWQSGSITVNDLLDFFDGKHHMRVTIGESSEKVLVPRAGREPTLQTAVSAIASGSIWYRDDQTSLCRELVAPEALLADGAIQAPPRPIQGQQLAPEHLPAAWQDGVTTPAALSEALVDQCGTQLPWGMIRLAIEQAIQYHVLRIADGTSWTGDWATSSGVRLASARLTKQDALFPDVPTRAAGGTVMARAEDVDIASFQDIAEALSQVNDLVTRLQGKLRIGVSLRVDGDGHPLTQAEADLLNDTLGDGEHAIRFTVM